ncbi:NAD(P)/FAD-dependent oxidoreductase [Pigmentiphaga aceris]|uniref:NAD(P)/FAD-dependent oxidoreductase n=1 Tax=Pigmentiphaga aceris TaxID=1940612 RepID=A0A5C0B770_9BURK|nr:NAD(P)/FAD-dependent oxidoreductase [Pigmentiphaga aceris]QEI08891.1 NAD(P)/FAD-dependent oxidoreductase [Pigmentiphaga aceris]
MAQPRVIVIGAGPAGVRCAQTLVAAGIRPTVIEEGRRDGGQIYRRQPESFKRSYETLYGDTADRAKSLHSDFDALRSQIDYRPETLAWNVANSMVYAVKAGVSTPVPFDALVVCAGATDRLMPIPGWDFAGTYSLGGAQIALKAQACSIGRQVVFMGTGPLLYLVAAQYVAAGAKVAAVLDTSPFSLRIGALPKLLAQPAALAKGMRLVASLKRARVPLYSGVKLIEITGDAHDGVQGVVFDDSKDVRRTVQCDAVGLGYHLRPETQLADLARCEFEFHAGRRLWMPKVDDMGRSSVKGVYLAGDSARVLGADAAEASGRLAAFAVLQDHGHKVPADQVQAAEASLARIRRFQAGLNQAFPWPHAQAADLPDHAVVCRCENVTAGDLRHVVNEMGAQEANRAKAFSRVGMGRCQGRYCGVAGAEIIAQAAGVPVELVGRLRGQAPIKPLTIAVEDPA